MQGWVSQHAPSLSDASGNTEPDPVRGAVALRQGLPRTDFRTEGWMANRRVVPGNTAAGTAKRRTAGRGGKRLFPAPAPPARTTHTVQLPARQTGRSSPNMPPQHAQLQPCRPSASQTHNATPLRADFFLSLHQPSTTATVIEI